MPGVDSIPGLSRTKTAPIPTVRTRRQQVARVLTSFPAGKMVPILAFPLHREDALLTSRFSFSFEMMETAEILMNAVNVNVKAYLVPYLAFNRFNGIDQLNRSYMGEPETDGGTVVPFFSTLTVGAAMPELLTRMGLHAKQGDIINSGYIEAYNEIWNFRAKNRSPDITVRLNTDTTLAKAFWQHQQFAHIVPDFDQALIDGAVPLSILGTPQKIPVETDTVSGSTLTVKMTSGNKDYRRMQMDGNARLAVSATVGSSTESFHVNTAGFLASLESEGIMLSLSNIEMARKSQAFAVLRKQYTGHDDDYIIDMLMQGITVPEQAWRQPILLADRSSIFGMSKRYSSDSTDLTASVVNGASFVDVAVTAPRCPTGGIVMFVAEVTPEQLFERQADPFLYTTSVAQVPDYLRDTLDPEKVEIVQNRKIDVKHATPTGTFGYAPLNWQWNQKPPTVGGKFYRPATDDPFDEDRMRIWSVETVNPTLSEDFYLCSNLHQKVFVVTDQDPFECVVRGVATIEGNTVFGRMLLEASDDYSTVMGEAPIDRIDKPVGTTKPADAAVAAESEA